MLFKKKRFVATAELDARKKEREHCTKWSSGERERERNDHWLGIQKSLGLYFVGQTGLDVMRLKRLFYFECISWKACASDWRNHQSVHNK